MAKNPSPVKIAPITPQVDSAPVAVAPALTAVTSDVPLPAAATRKSRQSKYDFSGLSAVGQSIGITNRSIKQVAQIVFRENRRHSVEVPDPNKPGKTIRNYSVRLKAFEVDPKTDPDGAKVRVFRVE